MNIKIPKQTYAFTSPMDLEFCTAQLSSFLGEAWSPYYSSPKRNAWLYKKSIKPVFKLIPKTDKTEFSAVLHYQRLDVFPLLHLSISGFLKQGSANQTQIVIYAKEKSHLYELYVYGPLAVVFGLGAIFATLDSIFVSLVLLWAYYNHLVSSKKHVDQYYRAVILPFKESINGTE